LAQIGGIAVNELQVYTPDPDTCAKNSEDFSGNVYGHGHVKLYEDISAFFEKKQPFNVTYADTLATIQLLNSFYISDETRSWVDVSTAGDSARLGKLDNELAALYRTSPLLIT
jgi:UDP-N-acetyl-2-amino-2-deoxyglucuronate dehydrogenase